MTALIDTESDPGSYLDMMAHSPCLRVEEYAPMVRGQNLKETI